MLLYRFISLADIRLVCLFELITRECDNNLYFFDFCDVCNKLSNPHSRQTSLLGDICPTTDYEMALSYTIKSKSHLLPATGMHSSTLRASTHCLDSTRTCNPCLDATKACNLNDTCKRQRSAYIATCNKAPAPAPPDSCNRKRCHKALRQFFDRVQTEHSYGLLFCSCRDSACAERRRQTIVPSCSFEEKAKPNCLELRKNCRLDPLCRSVFLSLLLGGGMHVCLCVFVSGWLCGLLHECSVYRCVVG